MLVAAPTILPLASISPANVEIPETFKSSNSAYPSTSKLPDIVKLVRVPRFVRDELTTPEPSVVAERTSVPSILYVLLEARFIFSLDLSEVLG